jgi:hypothetical protein
MYYTFVKTKPTSFWKSAVLTLNKIIIIIIIIILFTFH